MNDLIEDARIEAVLSVSRALISTLPEVDVIDLRQRVGMVFQNRIRFPKSIYENIAFGLRLQGITTSAA